MEHLRPGRPLPGWARVLLAICVVPVVAGAGVMAYRAGPVLVLGGALIGLGVGVCMVARR